MAVIHVNDENFSEKVLQSDIPVLLDFWAEWCGPCKMIAPVLDSIAEKLDKRIVVAKMDVDQNPQTPVKYGVRGIPMLLIIKQGQAVATKTGASSEAALLSWIEQSI